MYDRRPAISFLRDLIRPDQRKATLVFFSSVLLMVTWKHFCAVEFYLENLQPHFVWRKDPQATAAIYHFLGCFVLLGLIPALLVRFVLRESLVDYGVGIGKWRRTLVVTAITLPVFLLFAYFGSGDAAMAQEYPMNKSAGKMFALHAATYLLYYLGWEFHFRGFLQVGLRDGVGVFNAIWVGVMASTLLHIGKPGPELFLAILAGLSWGFMALYTRSLLAGILTHATLGILVDWLMVAR